MIPYPFRSFTIPRHVQQAVQADPSQDHSRALQAAIKRLPTDWRRRRGRPRQTWLRTIESDLQPTNLGLNSACTPESSSLIEYLITQMKRKITVSYVPFHLSPYWVTSNIIKRLRVTIRFTLHIAGAPKCASRTPETLPCARFPARARFPALRPRPAGFSHGAGPRADIPRGLRSPQARGPGQGPCSPSPMAGSVHAVCQQWSVTDGQTAI